MDRWIQYDDIKEKNNDTVVKWGNSMVTTASRGVATKATRVQHSMEWFQKEASAAFDTKGNCLSLSDNWQNLTGYSPAKCLGKRFFNLLRESDKKRFHALVTSPVAIKKNLRFSLLHAEGHWDWFEVAAMREEDGERILLLHHVSEEVKKDAALRKAKMETELALHGQSEFFAHISHELRTPLNAILGFAQMMHQGMFGEIRNPRYRDYVEIMEHSGNELLSKINDLLEISSLCAGLESLTNKNIPLPEMVKSVVDAFARELFCRHIRIEGDILPVMIVGDRVKLQQALSHLLRNALKFSPDDAVISLRAIQQEDGSLAFTVQDQGAGFSDAHLEYFQEKTQHFTFLERNRKLLGFGLPLAEEMVRLHGGALICTNAPAGGAKILFTLPASRIIAVIPEPEPRSVKRRVSTTKSMKH
jgi:PAS domain S-box-containing protein